MPLRLLMKCQQDLVIVLQFRKKRINIKALACLFLMGFDFGERLGWVIHRDVMVLWSTWRPTSCFILANSGREGKKI